MAILYFYPFVPFHLNPVKWSTADVRNVGKHSRWQTHIQEAMNHQKHRCENLKCSKCDRALRKERKQLLARCRNIRKRVNVDTKEAELTEVAWSDRVVECWSWMSRELGACLHLVCGTVCSDIQGSYFIWQVSFVTSCLYCTACECGWLSGQDEMTYGQTDWKCQLIVVT